MAQNADAKNKNDDASLKSAEEIFALENIFSNIDNVFSAGRPVSAKSKDVIVSFDTNILVLPYQLGKTDVAEIEKVFDLLSAEERVFIPARVIREFFRLRESKFAEMVSGLNNVQSKFGDTETFPGILRGLPGLEEMDEQLRTLKEAKSKYKKSIQAMIDSVKSWHGNDPISEIYRRVFVRDRIIEAGEKDRDKTLKDWRLRVASKIPPGYKDAGKSDEGIGDYLIWLSILEIGRKHKKDLLFVTHDGKADWSVRADKKALYPRPELIAEYSTASDGCAFHMCGMTEFLAEMEVTDAVVADVASAEAVMLVGAVQGTATVSGALTITSNHYSIHQDSVSFDYSTNDGKVIVGEGISQFVLRFGKASDKSIHLYKDGTNITKIGRIKNSSSGDFINLSTFDTSSKAYTVNVDEAFYAENTHGNQLTGRILNIMDDSRGDPVDEVTFEFNIFPANVTLSVP